MTNAVYPVLAGLKPGSTRTPRFRTRISESVSFIEARLGYAAYPIWLVELGYEFLRNAATNNELNKILAFFLVRGAARDSFLYTDAIDNAVTDYQFGTRDGVKTQFQLARQITDGAGNTFVEPVQNVNALTNIKSNGVALANPADYTISSTGLVTLAAAGTNGHALTWTGTYYWRMRFEEDDFQVKKFMYQLYEAGKVAMRGSVMNKILP